MKSSYFYALLTSFLIMSAFPSTAQAHGFWKKHLKKHTHSKKCKDQKKIKQVVLGQYSIANSDIGEGITLDYAEDFTTGELVNIESQGIQAIKAGFLKVDLNARIKCEGVGELSIIVQQPNSQFLEVAFGQCHPSTEDNEFPSASIHLTRSWKVDAGDTLHFYLVGPEGRISDSKLNLQFIAD